MCERGAGYCGGKFSFLLGRSVQSLCVVHGVAVLPDYIVSAVSEPLSTGQGKTSRGVRCVLLVPSDGPLSSPSPYYGNSGTS